MLLANKWEVIYGGGGAIGPRTNETTMKLDNASNPARKCFSGGVSRLGFVSRVA
jgi:hypothetical protein